MAITKPLCLVITHCIRETTLKAAILSKAMTALCILTYLAFTSFAYLSSLAMDKSGIGDIAKYEEYSLIAGWLLLVTALLWLLSVLFTAFSPKRNRGRNLILIGLVMPLIFFMLYILLGIIHLS
jgi:hypothetical protein